ncbi:MAG TPA: hypothetical protein VGO52_10750 [Hyphomonadaceae bacterium]|nr:hypothetical protein [Hyphomonadaceae bacterium]
MRFLLATAALLVLAGCTVTSIDPAKMTPAEFEARPDYMMIVPSVPKGVKVIGPVKADLCRKTKQDPVFSKEDVFRALKREAARQGATALAEVNSTWVDSGTRRCLEEGTASGIAFVRVPH